MALLQIPQQRLPPDGRMGAGAGNLTIVACCF
ncbi:MAG: hypothetical protein JWQ23_467 [Herminiimonas sp.]|nr:hypothetical protein [Herminiimonas sp.]